MTVSQRLGNFIEHEGITQSDLSRMLNVHRSAISNWFNEKAERVPPQKIIMIIEKFRNLNARWLITGEGEMLNHYTPTDPASSMVEEPCHPYGREAMEMIADIARENGILQERVRTLERDLERVTTGKKTKAG